MLVFFNKTLIQELTICFSRFMHGDIVNKIYKYIYIYTTFQLVVHVLTFEFDELNHFSDCLDLFFPLEEMLF